MKILLDENLPAKLKLDFGADHSVFTVRDMNWLGKRNGELLALLTENGFDAFVTIDKNLQNQQNLKDTDVRLFILDAPNNRLDTLQPFVVNLIKVADSVNDEKIVIIDGRKR
jgi:predicted nuclease of predicted toxin-antitoxin system